MIERMRAEQQMRESPSGQDSLVSSLETSTVEVSCDKLLKKAKTEELQRTLLFYICSNLHSHKHRTSSERQSFARL